MKAKVRSRVISTSLHKKMVARNFKNVKFGLFVYDRDNASRKLAKMTRSWSDDPDNNTLVYPMFCIEPMYIGCTLLLIFLMLCVKVFLTSTDDFTEYLSANFSWLLHSLHESSLPESSAFYRPYPEYVHHLAGLIRMWSIPVVGVFAGMIPVCLMVVFLLLCDFIDFIAIFPVGLVWKLTGKAEKPNPEKCTAVKG